MKIITISRQFGSGGRELGKRLADALGFDYYDREIITSIAQSQGLSEAYVEKMLDHHFSVATPITFRHSFSVPMVMNQPQTDLLVEQRKIMENISKSNRDCIIVGRNADVILSQYRPLRIFVCADMESKVRRCAERAELGEKLSRREMEQNIRRIDKNRSKTRELICDQKWSDPTTYDLTVNTSGWDIKHLTPAVAQFVSSWFEGHEKNIK